MGLAIDTPEMLGSAPLKAWSAARSYVRAVQSWVVDPADFTVCI